MEIHKMTHDCKIKYCVEILISNQILRWDARYVVQDLLFDDLRGEIKTR